MLLYLGFLLVEAFTAGCDITGFYFWSRGDQAPQLPAHVSLTLPLTTVGSTTLSVITFHFLDHWGTQSDRRGEKSSPLLMLL